MSVGSVLKKGANAVKKAASAAEIKMHRKYVWNDFSIGLEKAKLHILQAPNLGETINSISEIEFKLLHTLYVQINPSEFKFDYTLQRGNPGYGTTLDDQTKNSGMPAVTFSQEGCDRDLTIPLNYDIYDEFMARTGNESYPDLTGFSLDDNKATSLPVLVDDVQSGICFAQFVWGSVKKFGVVSKIDVTYSAFSRWGDPLKAIANLHINEWFLAAGEEINVGSQSLDAATALSGGEKASKVGKNIVAGAANIFR